MYKKAKIEEFQSELGFEYIIERKEVKRTKIKVYPDLTVKVITPENVSREKINEMLLKRQAWILKNIAIFKTYNNRLRLEEQPKKSGSTIFYLGKQYRLKIIEEGTDGVKLKGKYLYISAINKSVEELLLKWYRIKALEYFNKSLQKNFKRFEKYNFEYPELFIRILKTRWGSYSKSTNRLTLNTELIKTSPLCIEYVLIHELCHIKFQSHNRNFYDFLEMMLPNWKKRKQKLEISSATKGMLL